MLNYFLDCEFYEKGYERIDLISLALVCEDGREFYAVADEGWAPAQTSDWLKTNVLPWLPKEGRLPEGQLMWLKACVEGRLWLHQAASMVPWASRKAMASGIIDLVGGVVAPEHRPVFWGYFSDYDWVLFCQLFGTMMELPKTFPKYCRDLKQEMDRLGIKKSDLPAQSGTEHNALADARWMRDAFLAMKDRL